VEGCDDTIDLFSIRNDHASCIITVCDPGEISKNFTVPITDDTLAEDAETALVTLSNAVNATLGTPAAATLTIADGEDGQATIALIRIEPETLDVSSREIFTAFINYSVII
jgi:hypothetical protein